jgi:hypothetical protein
MALESRRFWKRMLTALLYRFHFEAICLAGFRVPVGKLDSPSAGYFINEKVK